MQSFVLSRFGQIICENLPARSCACTPKLFGLKDVVPRIMFNQARVPTKLIDEEFRQLFTQVDMYVSRYLSLYIYINICTLRIKHD